MKKVYTREAVEFALQEQPGEKQNCAIMILTTGEIGLCLPKGSNEIAFSISDARSLVAAFTEAIALSVAKYGEK